MKKKKANISLWPVLTIPFLLLAVFASGQTQDSLISERIAVSARPSADSITLRWAPVNYTTWRWGNTNGYRIERYTLIRNKSLLSRPEKVILHPSIKPQPEAAWEGLVANDKYAAIAAQALFGDRFEIDLSQRDVFTIVNKVRENEQRFAFALFCADMSPDVATASGLWFTDKAVKKGEKYLYRVVVNTMDSLRGSVFTGPDEPYSLPPPQDLMGDFKDQIVSLKWKKSPNGTYTAYALERSEDGKVFNSVSESPLVTVSPTSTMDTPYEYAIDSLPEISKRYYYRVKGITAFGEKSPASNLASGRGIHSVSQVPYISQIDNIDNTSLVIRWDFPATDNRAIAGFGIERAPSPKGTFLPLAENLVQPDLRVFQDDHPLRVNYYRVTAHGLDGEDYPSHVFFAQLVDSIPPVSPKGLDAKIDDEGILTLAWEPNAEQDLYGYRVYKSYHKSEELAQVTSEPIPQLSFTDQINLHTLNEAVYYSVMAVDINQNHSGMSPLLKVALPDKVRPQPPVFYPVVNDSAGISLRWIRASSEDVVQYRIYRRNEDKALWEQLDIVSARHDTLYHYRDVSASYGTPYFYTVIAVDEAGLESDPAGPVSGRRTAKLPPAINWKKPRIIRDQNQIILSWTYRQPAVQSFKIYRAVDGLQPVLFKSIGGNENEFKDTMIPGRHYRYRIIAFFDDGKKSLLSEEIEFRY